MRSPFYRFNMLRIVRAELILFLFAMPVFAQATAGSETAAWLRYAALDSKAVSSYETLPRVSVLLGRSPVLQTAQQELATGVEEILGRALKSSGGIKSSAIVLGTIRDLHNVAPSLKPPNLLEADGYWLTTAQIRHTQCLVITAANDRGVLYGVFALLSK